MDIDRMLKHAAEKSELHAIIDTLEEGDTAFVMVMKSEDGHDHFEGMCYPQSLPTHMLVGQLEHVQVFLLTSSMRGD